MGFWVSPLNDPVTVAQNPLDLVSLWVRKPYPDHLFPNPKMPKPLCRRPPLCATFVPHAPATRGQRSDQTTGGPCRAVCRRPSWAIPPKNRCEQGGFFFYLFILFIFLSSPVNSRSARGSTARMCGRFCPLQTALYGASTAQAPRRRRLAGNPGPITHRQPIWAAAALSHKRSSSDCRRSLMRPTSLLWEAGELRFRWAVDHD